MTASVRGRAAVACAVVAALVAVVAPARAVVRPSVATRSTPTVSAASVRDSIGVNVHMSYTDTGYADAARVTSLVTGLGVRHVRDALIADRPDQVAALARLGRAGVRSTLVVGGSGAPTASQLAELRTLQPYLDGVEAPNEYDCSGDPFWAADLRATERALDSDLATDSVLRRVPRLGPSFCRPDSVDAYGALDPGAGLVNVHDYSAGAAPELALESRVPATSRVQDPTAPVELTETGFHNATAATGWNAPDSEATAADYLLRTLLDARRIGVTRTFAYELLDEKPDPTLSDPEQHFGLVRADGTPKPAYTAIRNLLADLPVTTAATGPAPASPATVLGGGTLLRSLAIADPTGSGETLALWLAAPEGAAPARVSVLLPSAYRATLRRPSRGNAVTRLGTAAQFGVAVGPAVTLLHLAPASTGIVTRTCGTTGYAPGAALVRGLAALGSVAGTGLPDHLGAGIAVVAAGQRMHVPVPDVPTPWTIAVWERTAGHSASNAPFLHVTGVPGALLRTYDLTGDLPSHMQLSAYGAPVAGAQYGAETWGQALPGTWHLLTLSDDGSTARFAVDGVAVGAVPSGAVPVSGIELGDLGGGFRGALANLAVYPRVVGTAGLARLATGDLRTCRSTVRSR